MSGQIRCFVCYQARGEDRGDGHGDGTDCAAVGDPIARATCASSIPARRARSRSGLQKKRRRMREVSGARRTATESTELTYLLCHLATWASCPGSTDPAVRRRNCSLSTAAVRSSAVRGRSRSSGVRCSSPRRECPNRHHHKLILRRHILRRIIPHRNLGDRRTYLQFRQGRRRRRREKGGGRWLVFLVFACTCDFINTMRFFSDMITQ
mmetsp:Transcript_31472/g.72061  ORF Transcript_31472/g.72061 Transcript_31472/m.72061 type:complete len:209 (-) Transcript_31472:187-813(-)